MQENAERYLDDLTVEDEAEFLYEDLDMENNAEFQEVSMNCSQS